MLTYVLSQDGAPLMPTYNIKKVRRLLKEEKAVIAGHSPGFTIRLLYKTGNSVQPVEICDDTGYQTAGVSVKSEKHEFAHEEYSFLPDEKQRHDDRRKYRRQRRGRKRYRAPRFNNRTKSKPEGWIAPSLENKAKRHADIVTIYKKVLPVTDVYLEMGQFDTQVLEAVEAGKPVPVGTDYQHGPTYGHDTLREAVFARDNYTCICCGKSAIKDGVILRMHHLGFKTGDHSDRMSNLATVCTKCHTPKNHKPGGKLYVLDPKVKPLSGAAFMNTVKWYIYDTVKNEHPELCVHITYGTVTKRTRLRRHLEKTHANDAYCIGKLRPLHRAKPVFYKKRRRNNRILEKFYDAKYVDMRDKTIKKGAELSCGRTNRSVPRNNPQNERIHRGEKTSKGRRVIRKNHYTIQPGDTVLYGEVVYMVV